MHRKTILFIFLRKKENCLLYIIPFKFFFYNIRRNSDIHVGIKVHIFSCNHDVIFYVVTSKNIKESSKK